MRAFQGTLALRDTLGTVTIRRHELDYYFSWLTDDVGMTRWHIV
jgi:hypothetical protein